jgi:uncharacterized protein (DUF362 family)
MLSDIFLARTTCEYPTFPYDDHNHPLNEALRKVCVSWANNSDNPFAGLVKQGDTVVIKPNWVTHQNMGGYGIEALITHTSLVKYVIDYAAMALRGKGNIIIGDAPIQGCNFHKLIAVTRIDEVIARAEEKYPGITFCVEDWRLTILDDDVSCVKMNDYSIVDLGKDSFLEDIVDYSKRFRVSAYKKDPMLEHHSPGKHEYLVTNRVKQADLLINLPKMKTHIKAGLTGALKNIVGINGHKEFLPHHIKGAYSSGGDAYMRTHPLRNIHEHLTDWLADRYAQMSPAKRNLLSKMLDALRWGSVLCGGESTSLGSWPGNETIWRTTLDLNHILYFSQYSPKKVITIVDGIIAGEGQGPLKPQPKLAGILITGENPAYIDAVIAKLLGYNLSRIPTVYNAINHRRSKFAGRFPDECVIRAMFEPGKAQRIGYDELPNLHFRKPRFWSRAEE